MRTLGLVALAGALLLAACGPSAGGGDDDGGGDAGVDQTDSDGDSIADAHEGREAGRDTDGDGTPDWSDDDSDGDGIPDRREAGDALPGTAPIDTDDDDVPDFQDLDADGNGIVDADESLDDNVDGDGAGDWQDLDDDGDGDGDTITDADEHASDADGDGLRNFQDLDADADCIADADEAGDALPDSPPVDSDGDGKPDFVDVDSDSDGLADAAEDVDCDGNRDASETSAYDPDSDGDGATDLVEDAAGTDPGDASDNPQANGDFVFVVPYQAPPSPTDDDLDFSTSLKQVDVYVMMDLSGSMADELADIHGNMDTVLENLACPPAGSGTPGECIPDLWSGLGSFTYAERAPFASRLRMQASPAAIGNAALASDGLGCSNCDEPHWLALWMAATGGGTATSGCTTSTADPLAAVAAAPSCAGSPAGAGGIGYPCFRPDALPVILVATDEAPSASYTCPSESTAIGALTAIGARVIGIAGSGVTSVSATWGDLEDLASGTSAVTAAGTPMVYAGAGTGAADAIEDAIRAVASNLPLDMNALAQDDGADAVDAVTAFVDRLETLELGTAACADGFTTIDSDGDGASDQFVDVLPGTPVCWKLVAKENTTVLPSAAPQLYRAAVEVRGDGVTLLDTRDVYFLVPPLLEGPGVE